MNPAPKTGGGMTPHAWHWLCACGRKVKPRGLGRHRLACMFARFARRVAEVAE